jgi:hypothetical protein
MRLKYSIIILLFSVMCNYAYAEGGTGLVTGKVLIPNGKPMKHGLMLCYSKQSGPAPFPERYWRVPDIVVPVGSDGKFSIELVEGEYYIGAIGRESSKIIPGPPSDGDVLMLHKDKSGIPKIIKVVEGKTIDLGKQKGRIYRESTKKGINIMSVEGMITMQDNTPVPGAFVFAFQSPERGKRPVFASEKSDKDGRYILRVDGVGPYYLIARDTYGGGKPQVGQLKGVFGSDDDPAPVTILTGSTLKGINIKVQAIQRPDGN